MKVTFSAGQAAKVHHVRQVCRRWGDHPAVPRQPFESCAADRPGPTGPRGLKPRTRGTLCLCRSPLQRACQHKFDGRRARLRVYWQRRLLRYAPVAGCCVRPHSDQTECRVKVIIFLFPARLAARCTMSGKFARRWGHHLAVPRQPFERCAADRPGPTGPRCHKPGTRDTRVSAGALCKVRPSTSFDGRRARFAGTLAEAIATICTCSGMLCVTTQRSDLNSG